MGSKVNPSSAVLMSLTVPVKTIVASPVPSPVVKLKPATPLRVSVPLVAVSVTSTGLLPASISLIEI
ncbi:MAG: hypothetical protein E2O38_12155 [Proteobacteria bacterium]|nr:MAG: hypothetical protein E2O38_12155 [Pseudomonadota bacterium]